jgi:hypothetical protein
VTATWPSSITIHQLLPLSVTPIEARTVFQPEHGEPKQAPATTGQVYRITFDVLMSGTNLRNDFLAWWENELQYGSQPFTGLEHVVNDGAATYQFADAPPSFRLISGGATAGTRKWRAQFDLWALP